MRILVTGCAGFIGSALAAQLIEKGHTVVGIDNVNDYYDISLKEKRLSNLREIKGDFSFIREDVSNSSEIKLLFQKISPDRVVHLAAQAGVRYSLDNPHTYVNSNVVGFLNILEGCRHNGIEHLIYASTSSVYGLNAKFPLSEHQPVEHPVSLYAATKKANELMAHAYSHLFKVPTTGVRFFTVYGPWGRPDMALFLFTKNILEGKPIKIFNNGKHKRDFTYIDDLVRGLIHIVEGRPSAADSKWDSQSPDPASSSAPYRVFNIGNQTSIELMHYIQALEECLGKKAEKIFVGPQMGDVEATEADVTELSLEYSYRPSTPVKEGIRKFIDWYRDYYKI